MSSDDFNILCDLGDWAAYKSYGEILNSVVNQIAIVKLKENKEFDISNHQLHTRLKIFNILNVIKRLNSYNEETLNELLVAFDDLHNEYHKKLFQNGIKTIKWLEIRAIILKYIILSTLNEYVTISNNKIILSKDYNYLKYVEKVSNIIDNNLFQFKDESQIPNLNLFHDIEMKEIIKIKEFVIDLLSNVKKSNTNNIKYKLSDVKVINLFQDNKIEFLCKELEEYIQLVESKLLTLPKILILAAKSSETKDVTSPQNESIYSNNNEISTISKLKEKDWSNSKAKSAGPYTIQEEMTVSTRSIQSPHKKVFEESSTKTNLSATLNEFNTKNKLHDPLRKIERSIKSSSTKPSSSADNNTPNKPVTTKKQTTSGSVKRKRLIEIDDDDEDNEQPEVEIKKDYPLRSKVVKKSKTEVDDFIDDEEAEINFFVQNVDEEYIPIIDNKSKKSLIDSRPSAKKLDVYDSDFDNVEDSDFQPPSKAMAIIKDIPNKVIKDQKNFPKKLEDIKSKTVTSDDDSRYPQMRTKWTFEEEQALIDGIKRYGPGKWINIKEDKQFGPELENRSNVQLKDKYRNLKKQGVFD